MEQKLRRDKIRIVALGLDFCLLFVVLLTANSIWKDKDEVKWGWWGLLVIVGVNILALLRGGV